MLSKMMHFRSAGDTTPRARLTNNSTRGDITVVFRPVGDPTTSTLVLIVAPGDPPESNILYTPGNVDLEINIGSFPDDIDYTLIYTDHMGIPVEMPFNHGDLHQFIYNLQPNIFLTLIDTDL